MGRQGLFRPKPKAKGGLQDFLLPFPYWAVTLLFPDQSVFPLFPESHRDLGYFGPYECLSPLNVCTLLLFPLSCLVFAVFYWCEHPSSLCDWIADHCNLYFTATSHHDVALTRFPDGCLDLYHGSVRFPV